MKHAAADGAGDAQPVSNAFVDIAFACAAHAEHRHRQGPAQSLQRIDDDIFVAGQFPPSADVVKDVQVCRAPRLSLSLSLCLSLSVSLSLGVRGHDGGAWR